MQRAADAAWRVLRARWPRAQRIVVLCGAGSAIPGIAEEMEPTLGMPTSVARPEALAGIDPTVAARLTLPFGLALDS